MELTIIERDLLRQKIKLAIEAVLNLYIEMQLTTHQMATEVIDLQTVLREHESYKEQMDFLDLAIRNYGKHPLGRDLEISVLKFSNKGGKDE